jgi:uncharacterized membrane protein
MKRNTFYLIAGSVALILLGIFWYSVELEQPFLIEVAFIIAVGLVYLARKRVIDLIEDERSARITEKATLKTMQVFWVVFCTFSIGAVIRLIDITSFPPEFHPSFSPERTIGMLPIRSIGYIQLGLLCLMIFLYVGFRMYYAKKFGDWETDEE